MPPSSASGDLMPHKAFRLEFTAHPFTKFEVRRPSRSEDGWFSATALIDLAILTFEVSTSKWGHRSGFLPANFQLPKPFRSRLRAGTGQADGQTYRRQPSTFNAPPYGGGHNKKKRQAWKFRERSDGLCNCSINEKECAISGDAYRRRVLRCRRG